MSCWLERLQKLSKQYRFLVAYQKEIEEDPVAEGTPHPLVARHREIKLELH